MRGSSNDIELGRKIGRSYTMPVGDLDYPNGFGTNKMQSGLEHMDASVNSGGLPEFANKISNFPMDAFRVVAKPFEVTSKATFEVVTNFLDKLKEQSFELDSAEHGAIIADEIALCRKRSALISLFAVDIPFLTIRLIMNWYT